ncbi:hypothetical protein [Rhodopirellula sallentina]|nr:hypothetical protein [Rhodopirellula sallentina]
MTAGITVAKADNSRVQQEAEEIARISLKASKSMREIIAFEWEKLATEQFGLVRPTEPHLTESAGTLLDHAESIAVAAESLQRPFKDDAINILLRPQLEAMSDKDIAPPANLSCWAEHVAAICRAYADRLWPAVEEELRAKSFADVRGFLSLRRITPFQIIELVQYPLNALRIDIDEANRLTRFCRFEWNAALQENTSRAAVVRDRTAAVESERTEPSPPANDINSRRPVRFANVARSHTHQETTKESGDLPWREVTANRDAIVRTMVEKRVIQSNLMTRGTIVRLAGFDPGDDLDSVFRWLRKKGFTDSDQGHNGGTFLTEAAFHQGIMLYSEPSRQAHLEQSPET